MANNICLACLSVNRQFTRLRKYEDLVSHLIKVEPEHFICWECEAILRKWNKFVVQVVNAQHHLGENIRKSLSNLTEAHKHGFDKILQFNLEEGQQIDIEANLSNNFKYARKCNKVSIKEEELQIKRQDSFNNNKIKFESQFSVVDSNTYEDSSKIINTNQELIQTETNYKSTEIDSNPGGQSDHGEEILSKYKQNKIKAVAEKKDSLQKDNECISKLIPKDICKILEIRKKKRQNVKFKSDQYKCETCIKVFKRESLLKAHIERWHTKGPYICNTCEVRFDSDYLLILHKQTHYKCRKTSPEPESSYVTIWGQNVNRNQGHKCKRCKETFMTTQKLRKHRETSHGASRQCDVCGKIMSTTNNLRKHKLIHTGLPLLECEVCKKALRGVDQLAAHKRTHTENPENSYCVTCDRQYKNARIYNHHLMTSIRHCEKKFECDDCGKKFTTKISIRHHIRVTHIKEADFHCTTCGKIFITAYNLRMHVEFVHEKKPRKKDKVCAICCKTFANNIHLKNHMNIHTASRPFKCEDCPSAFTQSGALYNHIKLVHLRLKRKDKSVTISISKPQLTLY